MQSPLSLCLFVTDVIAQQLSQMLECDRYRLTYVYSVNEFIEFIGSHTEHIDCLIVWHDSRALPFFNQLYEEGCLLPIIILESHRSISERAATGKEAPTIVYHNAEIHLGESEWHTLPVVIDRAIAHYLYLGPSCALPQTNTTLKNGDPQDSKQSFLLLQQRRLADKLKERLGYLGVYYKRNPKCFYRNLEAAEKQEFLEKLGLEYREIILTYFNQNVDINQEIDQFVNQAFFADISASQILEIHISLMDEFSQHLKLEGRSEEILLDYRLALIDILAHLGEMYRRSIPREEIPFDIFYQTD